MAIVIVVDVGGNKLCTINRHERRKGLSQDDSLHEQGQYVSDQVDAGPKVRSMDK